MSEIKNKIQLLFSTAWSTPIDKEVCNILMKNKKEMLQDPSVAIQYINNFKDSNPKIFTMISNELSNILDEIILQPLTESINESAFEGQTYDGYWEDTSLKIKDVRLRKLKVDTIQKLKAMALQDYGIRLLNPTDPSEIGFSLIVSKIPMTKSVHFSNDCKYIDRNVVALPFVNPKKNFNIASKINKANKKLAMQENNLPILAMELLEKYNFGYNVNNLLKLIETDEESVKDICESASVLDVNRLVAMMEIKDIKENDTADINVPDRFIGAKQAKNRLMNYDPYGTISNVAPGSNTTMRFTPEKFNESIRNINISDITVLKTDLLETENYSNVILESDGKKSQIAFDKKDFINFVKNNTECSNFMENGQINFESYIRNRPFTFQSVLFKEYFSSKLNEDTDQNFTVDIANINYNNNQIEIGYFYPQDEEYRWKILSLDEFKDWLENNDWIYSDYISKGDRNKFTEFWDELEESDRISLAYNFMLSKENVKIQESIESTRYSDYNNWKSDIATQTNNNFDISNSKLNKKSIIKAVDSKMNVIGTWDYKNNIGYLRK